VRVSRTVKTNGSGEGGSFSTRKKTLKSKAEHLRAVSTLRKKEKKRYEKRRKKYLDSEKKKVLL